MSKRAWAYISTVLGIALGIAGWAFSDLGNTSHVWLPFIVLAAFAIVAQLVEAAAPARTSYYTSTVFFAAGIFLLPPRYFVLLIAIPHITEWAKEILGKANKRPWYVQPFNIAMHIIPGMIAHWMFNALIDPSGIVGLSTPVPAALLAVATYVLLNHLLLGFVLLLARNLSWRESQMLDPETLIPEGAMACLGYLVAVVWAINPWLILVALSPLVLVHRALMVPMLKHEAQRDGKTGLFNARHFNQRLSDELSRAARFDRPLSVIIADLDLLRNINNTYGHLAGDAVLAGIGQIINDGSREFDVAARFGGEEFAIVLPETELTQARAIAERLRQTIAAASFEVSTSVNPIQATMSLGIACFPEDGTTTTDLIHAADIAVYQAKLQGRNRVIATVDFNGISNVEQPAALDVKPADYAMAYAVRSSQPQPAVAGSGAQGGLPAGEHVPQPAQPTASPASVREPHSRPAVNPRPASAPDKKRPPALMWLLVGSIIGAGLSVTALGSWFSGTIDLGTLALMIVLAALGEFLHVNVYDENTMSVSAAVMFGAALVAGIPGVACVSAAIALIHYWQKRPAWYKTGFNWAVHVLAGSAPALLISALHLPLTMSNLAVLAGPVLATAVLYFVVESVLISCAISLATGARLHNLWHGQFRWLAGHYVILCVLGFFLALAHQALGISGALVFAAPIAMMRLAQGQYIQHTQDNVRELKRINKDLMHANDSIVQLNGELFTTLAKIFDARDPYVGGHAAQVASYAVAIAQELGLPSERVEIIRQAGYLHDIGKMAIPETILHKPGKLTDAEFEQIKAHTVLGAEFLEGSQGMKHLAPFVRYHHERWDGKGYPAGLQGEEIPLEARILNVCDSVEAMASDRPYHRGLSVDAIVEELERCSGTQFDPMVAATFVRIARRAEERFVVNSARQVEQNAKHVRLNSAKNTQHVMSGIYQPVG
jgi:diguanylate cyclase (GGDEF)-like protein/putative nucleotidyltransferase with HDIG domain